MLLSDNLKQPIKKIQLLRQTQNGYFTINYRLLLGYHGKNYCAPKKN